MKRFLFVTAIALLTGCASTSTELYNDSPRANSEWPKEGKPYPEGWPIDRLPFNPDPKVTQSIQLGAEMSEVIKVMGREGWAREASRREFLDMLRRCYKEYSSWDRLPEDLSTIEKLVPKDARFVYWRYQGFPTTADWIVVFFSSSAETSGSEPRVISRGIFRLGCL